MLGKHPIVRALVTLALAAGLAAAAPAADNRGGQTGKVFHDKPRIEDYADYNSFLVDIMEYRRQKDSRNKELTTRNAARSAQGLPPQRENEPEKTVSPLARDPYAIRHAESLDEALERARYLKHPTYDTQLRFNRTTSQSFPMEPLEGEEMSVAELPGTLTDTSASTIQAYTDTTASTKVAADTKTDPTDDEKARDTMAAADTYSVTEAGYDAANKIAIDSAGDRHSLQLANQYTLGEGDLRIEHISVSIEVQKTP